MQGGFIMAKMATWDDVNRKISTSNGPADKRPTKAEIEATGKGKVDAKAGINQLVSIDQVSSALPDRITVEFAVAGQYSEVRESYINGIIFDEYNPVSSDFDISDGIINVGIEIMPYFNNQSFMWNCIIMGVNDIQARSAHIGNIDFNLNGNAMFDVVGVANTMVKEDIITKCTYQGIELNLILSVTVQELF